MVSRTEDKWPTCDQDGCLGIRLGSGRMCLAHASEEETVAALKLIGETGAIDIRGVLVTGGLLERILTAAPRGENDKPLIKGCRFDKATFVGDALFDNATFSGKTWFNNATFSGKTRFNDATFSGDASFMGATFRDGVSFYAVTFSNHAYFSWATFSGHAHFAAVTFSSHAWFHDTTFSGGASFGAATFRGNAFFTDAVFSEAGFVGTTFEQTRQFGPLLAYQFLRLDIAQFAQPVGIEVASPSVSCRGARFPGGVQFRLRLAHVVLDDADLAAPSILAGVPRFSVEGLGMQDRQIAEAWEQLADGNSGPPQLMSLRRANVAGLGLSNISAADCRFAGGHNLDKLRLESDVSFATAPLLTGLGGRRWCGREVIAEERTWRASRSRRSRRRWVAPRWSSWMGDQPDVLDPGQIAGLYRALRKAREDTKDEPGAADFYYGEMEMRRLARRPVHTTTGTRIGKTSRGRVERWILTAYWLVSGYGLRAWRAVAWLAAVTALLALAFHFVGFAVPPRPVSYWTSLLYAFRATLSLTDDQVKLTEWGQLLQGVLRLTGPVLLGLALLALRGRVKR